MTGPWNPTKFLTVFTVTAPVLDAPSGTIGTNMPLYSWNAVSGATRYNLWVGNSGGTPVNLWYDASAICAGSTCSVTPAVGLSSATWYWTVRGQSVVGTGPWGATKSFTVQ